MKKGLFCTPAVVNFVNFGSRRQSGPACIAPGSLYYKDNTLETTMMRLLPALILLLLASVPAAAATRDYPAQGFDRMELRSAATVAVTAGPRFAVHADGDADLVRRLTVDVRGGTLVLGALPGTSRGANGLHVAITMPRVAGAAISGAGTIAIDRAEAPQFAADVGGAGTIRIAQLRAPRTTLAMGGTGQIVVAGRTARLEANVSGVGSIDAANLAADAGNFTMSGTGHIGARVNGPAAVSLSGMGSVVVAGNAQCAVQKSGLGSVRCGR
jgi:hypothetical protein